MRRRIVYVVSISCVLAAGSIPLPAQPVSLRMGLASETTVPFGGGTVTVNVLIENLTDSLQIVDFRVNGVNPGGASKVREERTREIPPRGSVEGTFEVSLHEGSPAGAYLLIGQVRAGSAGVVDTDTTGFTKLPENVMKLTGGDSQPGDRFGWSVSLDGDRAIAGSDRDEEFSGSAYIFSYDEETWDEEAKISAVEGDRFGHSVSISGDYVIVGSPWESCCIDGAAYIFEYDGVSWDQKARIPGSRSQQLGWSVSISNDLAIVGQPDWLEGTPGEARIYRRDEEQWLEETVITGDGVDLYYQFGSSVSIDGGYAVIGEYGAGYPEVEAGVVYVYKRTGQTWIREAKLESSAGEPFDYFGYSVSISGDYLIVGVPQDDDNGENSGSAYIYRRNGSTWSHEAKLVPDDGAASDWFGGAVSLSGSYALVGAALNDDLGSNSGSAYLFKREGGSWTQQAKLLAPDGQSSDNFGCSVSMHGTGAIIGAYGDDDAKGAAYLYAGFTLAFRATELSTIPVLKVDGVHTAMTPDNVPEQTTLSQNYPNPFNPSTTIRYELREQSYVRLRIFNMLGEEVARLVNQTQNAGHRSVVWDGRDYRGRELPSGVYIYQLQAGAFMVSRQLLLMK